MLRTRYGVRVFCLVLCVLCVLCILDVPRVMYIPCISHALTSISLPSSQAWLDEMYSTPEGGQMVDELLTSLVVRVNSVFILSCDISNVA